MNDEASLYHSQQDVCLPRELGGRLNHVIEVELSIARWLGSISVFLEWC